MQMAENTECIARTVAVKLQTTVLKKWNDRSKPAGLMYLSRGIMSMVILSI
jgi:hypothetical protein